MIYSQKYPQLNNPPFSMPASFNVHWYYLMPFGVAKVLQGLHWPLAFWGRYPLAHRWEAIYYKVVSGVTYISA